MAIERVAPNLSNGIELYVSNETGKSGTSQSGLARLCGISEMAMRKTLSDRTKIALILGKDILTADLYLELSSDQQARIIKAEYAAEIIAYYAHQAVNKTEIAKYSLRKFASIGIDRWIKESVGYVETHGNADQRLFDLLAVMGSDIKEMKADLASTSGYRAARIELPGLREWMEALDHSDKEQFSLPTKDDEPLFTLNEWADVDQNGMVLDRKQKHALANIVSSTYKMMALDMPQKVTRLNDKGQKLPAVQAYPERHFVLIRMCFAKLVNK
jgi:hypothetical protein